MKCTTVTGLNISVSSLHRVVALLERIAGKQSDDDYQKLDVDDHANNESPVDFLQLVSMIIQTKDILST